MFANFTDCCSHETFIIATSVSNQWPRKLVTIVQLIIFSCAIFTKYDYVSQSSVETILGWGGNRLHYSVANTFKTLYRILSKSAEVCRRYDKTTLAYFFLRHTVY